MLKDGVKCWREPEPERNERCDPLVQAGWGVEDTQETCAIDVDGDRYVNVHGEHVGKSGELQMMM